MNDVALTTFSNFDTGTHPSGKTQTGEVLSWLRKLWMIVSRIEEKAMIFVPIEKADMVDSGM